MTSDKITFNVALNNDLVTRAAAITVKLGGEMKRVSITQSGVIAKYASDTFYRYSENVAFSRTINFTSTATHLYTMDLPAASEGLFS